MKKRLTKVIAFVLAVITVATILPGMMIRSKAAGLDYSKIAYSDGYYMTYDQIVEWANYNKLKYRLIDNGNYKTLDVYMTDKNNNKGYQKIYSAFVSAVNSGNKADDSFNAVLHEVSLNNNYIYEGVKSLEKVQKLNEYVDLAGMCVGAYEGFNADKIHFCFQFSKDSQGKVYRSDKPKMIYKTMLYKNNENKYKNGDTFTEQSNWWRKNGNPVSYDYSVKRYSDNGLYFWAVFVAPSK